MVNWDYQARTLVTKGYFIGFPFWYSFFTLEGNHLQFNQILI